MSQLTQSDVDDITDAEVISGTTKSLPDWKNIPKEFRKDIYNGTVYGRIITGWYTGDPIPDAELAFNPGFREDGKAVYRFINAHLKSFQPDHDHKIAGCAYLLSQIMTITE